MAKDTMMLAQLLPGIRDLRTPFASGVLWIAFGWLLLSETITRASYPHLFDSLDSLADALSPLGLGAGLSLGAYLVGAAFEFVWMPLFRALPALSIRGRQSIYRLVSDRLDKLPDDEIEVLAHCRSFSLQHGSARGPSSGDRLSAWRGTDPGTHPASNYRSDITIDLLTGVQGELDLAATRLLTGGKATSSDAIQGAKALFDVYDRLQAEAEFRVAITAPVCGLLVIILLDLTSGWVAAPAGLLSLVVFLGQGAGKKTAAGDRIVDAMLIDVVEAPVLSEITPGTYTHQAIDDGRIRVAPRSLHDDPLLGLVGIPFTTRMRLRAGLVIGAWLDFLGGIGEAFADIAKAMGDGATWLPRSVWKLITTAIDAVRFAVLDIARTRGYVLRERRRIRSLPLTDEARGIGLGDLYRDYGYFREATKAYPSTPEGVMRTAEAAIERSLVHSSRSSAEALEAVLVTLVDDGRLDVAERVARQQLRSRPGPANLLLGDVLRLQNDLSGAEEAYSRAAAVGVALAHMRLGEMRRRRNDVDGARSAFSRAADLGVEGAHRELNRLGAPSA